MSPSPGAGALQGASHILIVNVNWIGDVLFSTPAIRAIRRACPAARLVCAAPGRSLAALRGNPALDELWDLPSGTSWTQWTALGGFGRKILKSKFDAAVFFHRSRTRAAVAALAGIPVRIGYRGRGDAPRFLTQPVSLPASPMHKIDWFLHLLGASGISGDGRFPDFFPSSKSEEEAQRLLAAQGLGPDEPFGAVHAGGNWPLKRWPLDRFSQWIRLFRKKTGWKVVLCGAPSEAQLSERLVSQAEDPGVLSVSGKTSLETLAGVLRRARFLVSNDSGPIHLAASQATPIVGLYGPTRPDLTGPVSRGPVRVLFRDVGCEVPCYFRDCDTRDCLNALRPEEVQGAVEAVIASAPEKGGRS